MTWADLNSYAPGLTALAAVFAVVVGPALQSWGSVRQGRSQAIGIFATEMVKTCISEIAQLINLTSDLYSADVLDMRRVRRELYATQLKISLIIGRSTPAGRAVCDDLERIQEGAFAGVSSGTIEAAITDLKVHFEVFLALERKKIQTGR